MKLMRESVALIAIGIADLVTTLLWVHNSGAKEANPIFRTYLELGDGWFVAAKILMLGGPIFLLEWAHKTRPHFARMGARLAAVSYICLYGAGVFGINRPAEASQSAHLEMESTESFNDRAKHTAKYREIYSASRGRYPRTVKPIPCIFIVQDY